MIAREKILLAIYHEYQKGNNDMRNTLQPAALEITSDDFFREVQMLKSDGFIDGAVLIRERDNPYPYQVILQAVNMTSYGLAYVQQNLLA